MASSVISITHSTHWPTPDTVDAHAAEMIERYMFVPNRVNEEHRDFKEACRIQSSKV